MNNQDALNPSKTRINPSATPIVPVALQAATTSGAGTIVNPIAGAMPISQATVINPNAVSTNSAHVTVTEKTGTVVNGQYTIESQMAADSGEADIYICHDSTGKQYCLKHYRRTAQVRKEVHNMLLNIQAPYVARLIAWGYWDEKVYEVWPLFTNGSLAGKHFDEQSIERYIVQMNAAIHAIHNSGLVHQDIKPANFMFDDAGNIELIDFGISAVRGEGGRTHVTQVGRTTDYASPEVLFSQYCWPASDYYSLGITIYELLRGITPYHNYDENMLQRKMDDIRDTKIPGINTFSKRMQNLLIGLLQYKKESRWTFEAVCDWLKGEGYYNKWIIKGAAISLDTTPIGEKRFKFDGNMYSIPSQLPELITNMAYRWDIGVHLFDTQGHFERLRQTIKDVEGTEDIYAICNTPKQRGEDSSLNYFRKLYQLYPGLTLFTWKQYQYENKEKLGEAILNTLWAREIDNMTTAASPQNPETGAYSIFRPKSAESVSSSKDAACYPSCAELEFGLLYGVVSQYLRFIGNDKLASDIAVLENAAERNPVCYYRIAYTLSKSTKLRLPSGTFSDKEAFLRFVKSKIEDAEKNGDAARFLDFFHSEIFDGKAVNTGFQAWVESLGLVDTLSILTDAQ